MKFTKFCIEYIPDNKMWGLEVCDGGGETLKGAFEDKDALVEFLDDYYGLEMIFRDVFALNI